MAKQTDMTHSAPRARARTWTPLLITQLVVVLAVFLSGLTGAGVLRNRDGGTDVLSVVQAASTSASSQPTLRATYRFGISGSGIDITSRGEMLIDTVHKVSSGTFQAPGLGELLVVSSGDVAYARLPDGKTDVAGKHWLSYRSPQGAAALGGQDPLAFLRLAGDPKDVETVGREKVHGVRTTHYRVTLDPKRLADTVANSGSGFTLPPGALDQLKGAVLNLWVDDNKLPRRLTMAFTIQQVKASFTFEFRDYGQPVEVTLPDAGDVAEVSSPQELGARLAAVVKG